MYIKFSELMIKSMKFFTSEKASAKNKAPEEKVKKVIKFVC